RDGHHLALSHTKPEPCQGWQRAALVGCRWSYRHSTAREHAVKSRRSWLQLLFLTLPWALVNGACVRLNEPTFLCESDADCEGSQKCYASHCQAKDYCRSSLDCGEL